jgi:hypothetical protein
MIRRNRIVLGIASLGLAVGLGYAIRAAASGIPATNALSYTGVLEDSSGPITGSHSIQAILYDAATAGNVLCQTTAGATVTVTNGHFSIQLPDTCTTAVGGNPNAWVDVLVDGSDTGRTKIGAVPYAVEANHAPNADNATNATNATTAATANAAGGTLASTISTIQGEIHPASAFRASMTSSVMVPSNTATYVAFNQVAFDLGGEYSTSTGTFTPKNAGVYIVTCSYLIGVLSPNGTDDEVIILKNGTEIADSAGNSSAVTTEFTATAIVQANAGDAIRCQIYQLSSATQTIVANAPDRNTFSAARLY